MVRVRFPAAAPIPYTGCASARGRVSKTQLTPGSTEAACQFHCGTVADKQCTCLASKLMWERYPPAPPISKLRETRPMHREKPHKLLQVGVTPTPATKSPREVIRLPDCKSGVVK